MIEDDDNLDNIEEDEEDRGDVVEEDELENEVDDDSEEDNDENVNDGDEEDEDGSEDENDDEVNSNKSNIPISRLNEVIAQREAEKERSLWLEEQLEKLINQKTTENIVSEVPKEIYDFNKAEEDYATLLIEGETGKAANLRATIEVERRKEIIALISEVEKSTSEKATNSSKAEIETARFDNLISKFEGEYSFLDADSEDYNDEAVDTVNTLLAGYVASGKTKSQALKMAVNKVSPMYAETEEVKPSLGNKKKVAARKKAAKASNTQPPVSVGKRGSNIDTDKVNIAILSEKAFKDLTLKERKILRGD